ncbi:pyridoxamine 5'-phosphate oxidase family protein [Paenibacillus campi]|uniref:pyridoxamine 5'-phosphate oxidase family protein n=1 Tax=Paenibacillus campi TaxID=3106031 RepID=UPI002AFFC797|nr:pyridoxamine 5'-phosphate oxidase family protein [Paenibacillus sp. SGZ-1009]
MNDQPHPSAIPLPPVLCELWNGQNLEHKQHMAMPLITVSEDGYPHQAIVSVGEVLVMNAYTLRIALWTGTQTTANLLRDGRALLTVVIGGSSYALRLRASVLSELPDAAYPRVRFTAQIEHVREDIAKYAELLTGVTYRLHEPVQVVQRWQLTLDELRK